MRVDIRDLLATLNQEDVESLLEAGAPTDEYEPEASMIAEAVSTIPDHLVSETAVTVAIAQVWGKMFSLGPSELALREPAFTRIAKRLVMSR